jgi:phage protein D
LPEISYNLYINDQPASQEILVAIQKIEVEDHANMADMLGLQMAIAMSDKEKGWTALDEDIFQRLSKIKIEIVIGSSKPKPLIDSYVIETSAQFSNEPGKSLLKVIAMDSTVLMNLDEKVRPWPNMADSDIATSIFQEYGMEPVVDSTQPSRQDVDTTTIQRETDIQFLKRLSDRYGYDCYVDLNSQSGKAEGHFHKPKLDAPPQGVLTINMGSATNVNSFKSRYEMLRPITAQVTGVDIETQENQPAKAESASHMSMGKEPLAAKDRPRKVLLSHSGLVQTGELNTYAQAMVDESSWAIIAEGELNTVAYGGVLKAKSPVLVRGAGNLFSGLYYIEKVLHIISGNGYVQRFSLKRNAIGLTKKEDFAEDRSIES